MATNITAITATGVSSKREQSKQFQGLFSVIPFVVTLQDASLAAQVAGQVDITVPGAEIGDFVLIAPPVDVAGVIMTAFVSAANTVTITTFNVEGTDANTTLATAAEARGLVLKTRDEVWADPDG
jgi:hypothetical protein